AKVLRGLDYLYDPSRQLSVRDLTRPAAQSAFRPFPDDAFAHDRRPGAHWLKLAVAASEDRPFDYLLLFSQPGIAAYSLFMETIPGEFDERRFSRAEGRDDVDVRRGAIGHRVTLGIGETRNLYVRLIGNDLAGTLMLWQPRAWQARAQQEAAVAWVTVAMAVAAGLLSLLGLGLRRVRGTLWAALYGFGVAAAIAALAGFVFETPWLWRYGDVVRWLAPALAMAAFAGLAAHMLALPPAMRWPRALLQILAFAALGAAVAGIAFGSAAIAALQVLAVALAGAVAVLAGLSLKRRLAPALWLLGLTVPLLGAGIAVLARMAGWPLVEDGLAAMLWSAAAFSAMVAAVAAVLASEAFAPAQDRVAEVPALEPPERQPEGQAPAASPANAPRREPVLPRPAQAPSPAGLIVELEARIGQLNRAIREREEELGALRGAAAPGQWTDPLTGVAQRAALLDEGRAILAQAQRYGRAVTVMLIEVDDYDLIAEQLGKAVCDKAMKLLAVSCLKNLRGADRLGRYDDKRFAAILPETDAIGAAALAKRLSQTLVERTLPTPKGMLQLSAIIAYTEFGEKDGEIEALFARAERVLAEDHAASGTQAAAE
ncbi:MAG: diguanylate cyclase, partial [Alphaproteobacteria bacterium]